MSCIKTLNHCFHFLKSVNPTVNYNYISEVQGRVNVQLWMEEILLKILIWHIHVCMHTKIILFKTSQIVGLEDASNFNII